MRFILAPPPQHVRCDVEVFNAAVSGCVPIDSRVAGSRGKGTAVRYLFLDISGVCLVDD